MKKLLLVLIIVSQVIVESSAQLDTTYIYNQDTPYGTLDIRLAKSDTRYYYLQENVTFSYRESAPGVKTNTYRDMTAWDSSPYTEGNLKERVDGRDDFIMNYRLLKPLDYQANYSKGYPLMILLHGSGEKGNCWNSTCYHADGSWNPNANNPAAPTDADHKLLNNDHNLLHGGKIYLDAVMRAEGKLPDDPTLPVNAFPGFVFVPQNLTGWNQNAVQDALRIVRLLLKKYNIDEDRIFINGISNGGHGAYEAIKRAPWMFASAIMMSAVDDGFINNAMMQEEVASIPLWIFQGATDTNPLPGKTRSYIKRFRDAGMVIRYTEYADLGHTTWNRAYKEPDFFTWLLGLNRSAVHVFAGSPTICNGGLLMELPEGFQAYEWQKNGVTIADADEAKYTATTEGNYRARFSRVSASPSESEWNEWSPEVTVTMGSSPTAEIVQTGTVLLKDLNNGNNAYLRSSGEYAHYYWYKNGTLLNLPGDEDDTLRSIIITPGNCTGQCSNNGAYTLVVAGFDNCKSDPSDAKHVFFNDQAPTSLSAPTSFTASAQSLNVSLSWEDNASGENGYEVWRRMKGEENQYSPWSMVALTNANTNSFTDQRLVPNTVYEYKVRAVSNTARSTYTPSGTSGTEVTTGEDTEMPGTPMSLKGQRVTLDSYRLIWTPASDNSGIKEYQISGSGINTTVTDTTYLLSGLKIDSTYDVSVTAIDLAGNEGEAATIRFTMNVSGLLYQHTPGSWPELDSIDWNIVEYRGTVPYFTLSEKTQEDYFNFRFEGFIYITSPGSYQFRISSDDGSRLRINNKLVIDNDGIHELQSKESNAISLVEGANRISADFFDYISEDTLIVEYKGADTNNEWMSIPESVLRSNVVIATEPGQREPFVLDVFPNPAMSGDLNVKVTTTSMAPMIISLIDPKGKVIHTMEVDREAASSGTRLLSDTKLTPGIYFVTVSQGNLQVQRKVIITH